MKIKKGDNVIVLTGKDRGKSGEVIRALPALDRVIVEGVNISKRHVKSKQGGGIVEKAMPVHVSNVKITEKKTEKKAETKKGSKKKEAGSKKETKAKEITEASLNNEVTS